MAQTYLQRKRNKGNKSPRKILINYASPIFEQTQIKNTKTGLRYGGFDQVISFKPQDIDAEFQKKNHHILSKNGERGWCLWKPYIIFKTLNQMEDGGWLFYSDSGSFFINPIDPLIRIAEQRNHDVVIPMSHMHIIEETRRDTLILMGMDSPAYLKQKMRPSTYILLRNSPKSRKFTREWLELAQDERLSTNNDNVMGKPNYPEFKWHRTQSIPSLLYIKHGFADDDYVSIDQWQPVYSALPDKINPTHLMILVITARRRYLRNIITRTGESLFLNVPLIKLSLWVSSIIHRIDKNQETNRETIITRDRLIRRDLKWFCILPQHTYMRIKKSWEYCRNVICRASN